MFMFILLALTACDTVRRANTEEEALANCEVLAALAEEHCGPEDPTFGVHCAWGHEIVFGRAPNLPPMTDCLVHVCDAALAVAEEQCERGALFTDFQTAPPESPDTATCCEEPGPGCEIWVGCY